MTSALLLDTNLLVLFVVGSFDKSLIERHKRTKTFTKDDFDLLLNVIDGVPKVLVTSQIVAETSNLVAQIGEPIRSKLMKQFAAVIQALDEAHVASKVSCQHRAFTRLGITDCGILEYLSVNTTFLLTDDFNLYLEASNLGYSAQNFNHLRQQNLLS